MEPKIETQPAPLDETPDRLIPNLTRLPESIPDETTTNVIGEAPSELLNSAINDLSDFLSRPKDDIRVVSAEYVIWSDGSLGCPEPGAFYAQVEEPGYRIVLETDGVQFAYHANDSGFFFICNGARPASVLPSDGTPDS
jgi:hypothetical protein